MGKDGLSLWASALTDDTTMSGYRSNSHGAAVGVGKQWARSREMCHEGKLGVRYAF